MKWIIAGIDVLIAIFNALGGGEMRPKPGFWRTAERVVVGAAVMFVIAFLCYVVYRKMLS